MPPQSHKPPLLSVTGTSGQVVDIGNFSGVLPPPSQVKDRNAFVRAAAGLQLGLNDDALHAIARAVTDPAAAATTVKSNLLTTEVVGPVDVQMLSANVWLSELFLLMQPRAGGFAHSVDPPSVAGTLDRDGDPAVELEVTFRDSQHLHDYIVETVLLTKAHGRDYANSILAKRVARPGLAHVARICFEDQGASFVVLCVRDGITRAVSSWAAQHPTLAATELAELIADRLLTSKAPKAPSWNESMARARGREGVAAEMRGRFVAGVAGQAPTEDAVRIGQSFTLPMQICVGMHQRAASSVGPERVFDDTMQAVIASVHGEFRPWEPSATQTATIRRAIPRAVHTDHLDPAVAELAVGTKGVESMTEVFGEGAPSSDLWRAVYLMSHLTSPRAFEGIKRHMREVSGAHSISRRSYISHLATLIDLPWQRVKAHTERQARRAWSNGGPFPASSLPSDWDPVPTDDFITLVPAALAGDLSAKHTLVVAGGVALITDKLLMANVGSAAASGAVPFRADVDVVVDGLATSRHGLCLLAHAANAFDAARVARNSYTAKELAANPRLAENTYVVPMPDPQDPTRVARDATNELRPLTTHEVVRASNPVRAQETKPDGSAHTVESVAARAHRLRSALLRDLRSAATAAEDLMAAATADGAVVGGAFGDRATYEAVDALMRTLQLFVLSNAASVVTERSEAGQRDGDGSGEQVPDRTDEDEQEEE